MPLLCVPGLSQSVLVEVDVVDLVVVVEVVVVVVVVVAVVDVVVVVVVIVEVEEVVVSVVVGVDVAVVAGHSSQSPRGMSQIASHTPSYRMMRREVCTRGSTHCSWAALLSALPHCRFLQPAPWSKKVAKALRRLGLPSKAVDPAGPNRAA